MNISTLLTESNDCYGGGFFELFPNKWTYRYLPEFSQLSLLHHLDKFKTNVIFARLGLTFDKDVFTRMKCPRYLVTPTTGLTHIDLESLKGYDVTLLSLKGETNFLRTITSTAEHAWALLLWCSRKLNILNSRSRSGKWYRDDLQLNQISGKTIGIIGFGRLGQIISDYAKAFRMNIKYYDPFLSSDSKAEFPSSWQVHTINNLLSDSDYVIMSASYTPNQPYILSLDHINHFKPGASFINIARGELVEEDLLIQAIDNKILSRIAVDVLEGDSAWSSSECLNSRLLQRSINSSDILITPHVGGYSKEAIIATRTFMLNMLISTYQEQFS